jgi:hypothetical protein
LHGGTPPAPVLTIEEIAKAGNIQEFFARRDADEASRRRRR